MTCKDTICLLREKTRESHRQNGEIFAIQEMFFYNTKGNLYTIGNENMKTQILYEDKDILVCYKPAGIAVQSANIAQQDMVSELKNYLRESQINGKNKDNSKTEAKGAGNSEPYLALIHRLDQPVSGVLVFGKNKAAAASLSAQVQDGRAEKVYRALVYGGFAEGNRDGVLEHILIKEAKTNTSKVVLSGKERVAAGVPEALFVRNQNVKDGKKAKLEYKVLNQNEIDGENYAELEIKLFTGRHHQIRVQMAASGHPILGDAKYGHQESTDLNARLENKGLKLCAYQLSFIHPGTKKTMTFEVPVKPW